MSTKWVKTQYYARKMLTIIILFKNGIIIINRSINVFQIELPQNSKAKTQGRVAQHISGDMKNILFIPASFH